MLRSNPVSPDPRVEKEAHALGKYGFGVRILCWDRGADYRKKDSKIKLGEKDVPICRIGCRASFGEGIKNIVPFAKFQVRMGLYLFSHRKEYDIIHACDFDTAFISSIISVLAGKKLVYDIFDFICGRPHNILQRMVKKMQLAIINRADATIICTEKRKEQIQGSHPKLLAVIHNTPDCNGIPSGEDTANILLVGRSGNMPSNAGLVRVVYVGILQDHRLLKEITACIAQHPEIEFHVGGFGKYEGFMEEAGKKHQNIIWHGKLQYEETIKLEQESDIQLAVYDPAIENHGYAAPNKFYEALMLGRPLVMARGTGMSEIVEENDIGALVEYSQEGFEEGLMRLVERKPEWPEMGERMRRIYTEQFSWAIMEKRLIQLYEGL